MTDATLSQSEGSGTNAPLSKSQKKRMKRLKSKQRKEEAQRKNVIDSLNPFEKLCHDVVNQGYERSDVDAALDEMWTKGLNYSDLDTVLKYLEEKTLIETVAASASEEFETETETPSDAPTRDTGAQEVALQTKEDTSTSNLFNSHSTATISTSTSSPASSSRAAIDPVMEPPVASVADNKPSSSEQPLANGSVHDTPPRTKASNMSRSPSNSPVVLKKKMRVKPFDLNAKLGIVANSEKLTDGIIALSEWVNNAATAPEIKDLCSNKPTNALQIVVRRSVLSDGNSTGQLLDLIGSILRSVGIPSSDSVPTAKAFASLVKEGRESFSAIVAEDPSIAENIADGIAKHFVDQVANVVEQSMSISSSSANITKRLNEEIQKLKIGMKKSTGSEIMDLMMKRDKSRAMTEKYVNILEFTASVPSENVNGGDSSEAKLEQNDIMASILGDKYDDVVESESKYNELKSSLSVSNPSTLERDALVANVDAKRDEKKKIISRMDEIKRELAQLTIQLQEVDDNMQSSESKLEALRDTMNETEKQNEALLSSTSQKMKVKETVSNVSQKIYEVRGSLDALVAKRTASNEGASAEMDEAKTKLPDALLSSVLEYFESELNATMFLKKRAEGLEDQVVVMQREIKECEALGMTTTVSDMKKNLKKCRQDIMDDYDLVEGCLEEAKEIKRTYGERLYECVSESYAVSDDDLTASYTASLNKILSVEKKLGLDKEYCISWSKLLNLANNQQQVDTASQAASVVTPVIAEPPSKPLLKKKGWNLSGTPTTSQGTKSIVEIQKEELVEEALDGANVLMSRLL